MRPWIAHIISNAPAYNDFHTYVNEILAGLSKSLTNAVRSDKMEKARGIAHEIQVYEDLKKAVSRELREQRAQVTYINETKGA